VAPAFAAGALRVLVGACAARGIAATVGARYPARHRENLLQLFTPRYAADSRAVVRALADLAPRVDAVQLELGIPLRWPGPWRRRFLEACAAALPALVTPEAIPRVSGAENAEGAGGDEHRVGHRLEFTSPGLCGLVGLDRGRGGRLLLFPPGGGLVLFTGERTGGEPRGVVGGLELLADGDDLGVRFAGPLLRFPDATPFLDLERGLAGAELVEAEVALTFSRDASGLGTPFGRVAGEVTLGATRWTIAGHGVAEDGGASGPWPRVRAALRVGEEAGLVVTVPLGGGEATGFVTRGERRVAVATARATLGPTDAPLERFALEVELASGERIRLVARALHRLPVIRAHGPRAVRLEFAACVVEGERTPAGWCEVGGI
jgi:hypothetical protein